MASTPQPGMSLSNKVGFVLLVLLVGFAVAVLKKPPVDTTPAPSPSPSASVPQMRHAPQSPPSPAVTP